MHYSTKVVRAGIPEHEQGQPFLPGPTFAGVYHAAGDPKESPYTYGRFHNPTWTLFEKALTELEGGSSVVFPSGMAAVAAVFNTTLRPGNILVMPSDSYYTSRLIAQGHLAAQGVEVRMAPTAGNAQLEILEGATLLWLESPSNPGLDVCDIAALSEAAHARGILVAVDNTTPTVLGQQPLALGADFSVSSDTKALTGHSDLVLGHVSCRDEALTEKLRTWRTQQGVIPGPMEVWLAHRSLSTLALRLERQSANALALARFLQSRPEVKVVRYPGLPTDPAYPTAVKQMQFFGPVVSFVLGGKSEADQFLTSAKLIIEATSFGGIKTSAERRARWSGDQVPEGFIRMSAGCEDINDLLEDFTQALATIA